jgi:hypothetical protein
MYQIEHYYSLIYNVFSMSRYVGPKIPAESPGWRLYSKSSRNAPRWILKVEREIEDNLPKGISFPQRAPQVTCDTTILIEERISASTIPRRGQNPMSDVPFPQSKTALRNLYSSIPFPTWLLIEMHDPRSQRAPFYFGRRGVQDSLNIFRRPPGLVAYQIPAHIGRLACKSASRLPYGGT